MSRRIVAALVVTIATLVTTAAPGGAASARWPDRIPLPDGYRPEGIASAGGTRVFVGSIPTGAVSLVDVRTGAVDAFVAGRPGRAAIGLEEAGGLLFVAGGPTGSAFVYDARTGADVATIALATTADTFINDVVVTRDAAWFTDSRSAVVHRVDRQTLESTVLPLRDFAVTAGFNLNGIEASPDGRTLYAVQSSTGILHAVDTSTGATTPLLDGLVNGDGLLREGTTLYVVQNRLNKVAVIDLRTASVVDEITSGRFDVPTTIARVGSRLYLPNARFSIPPTAETRYDVVGVDRL